jgi:hypothetical protein
MGTASVPIEPGTNVGVVVGPNGTPAGVSASGGLPGVASTTQTKQISFQAIWNGINNILSPGW